MKQTLKDRLFRIKERHEELGHLLGTPEILNNTNRFREYSKEYAELGPLTEAFNSLLAVETEIASTQNLMSDPDFGAMAEEELRDLEAKHAELDKALMVLLLPKDPDDDKNVFVEIRAGTGGDEAALFAGDLLRMYLKFAEKMNWQTELMTQSVGEHGGYKEVVMQIRGQGIYSLLKFESGTHRVQRVPATEAQGRVHTSTCTVAVLPQQADVEAVEIDNGDLRIDTYRASGAGGQHVNRTDSAIRITHIPSGLVVECQEERSQHKNRAKAMALLQARLFQQQRDKQVQERADLRKSLVGTGDRSERIRTYNYAQGRVTDHRINLTLYRLPEILEGDLIAVVESLVQENQALLLAALDTSS